MSISDFNLSPKQAHSIATSTARVNLWEGAIRSGKTIASLLRFCTVLADPPKGGELVITGRNMGSIFRNIFAPFTNSPQLAWASPYVDYRENTPQARMFGHRVNVIPANDILAADKVQGLTMAAGYADEITVLPENFFRQLLGRMSPPGAIFLGTMNPDNPNHWIKNDFLDQSDALGWNIYKFTMKDNPGLTPEYVTAISAEYSGLWYDRFILGKWVSADGAIYDMWDPTTMVVPHEALPPMRRIYAAGIDYGTTNATAAVLLGHGTDGTLYFIDEWRVDATNRHRNLTDAELSERLTGWLQTNRYTPEFLIIDPAAASFRTQLLRDGINNLASARNDVLPGIRLTGSLLAQGRLKVSDQCAGLIDEFPGYTWDAKAAKNGEDKPVKTDDHCLVPGTLIATSRGDKPIEEVEIGDLVMTRNGWSAVTDAWRTSPDTEVMTVTTSDGRAITGTPNHRVWTENRGWVSMDALRYADILVTWENELNQSSSTESLSGATPTPKGHQTGTTTALIQGMFATASKHSTVKSGKQYTAQSQTDTTSTTPTTTQATTTHRTLFASPAPTIERTTPTTHAQKPRTSIGGASSNERPNGTDRPRVGRGTPNTDAAPTPTVKLNHSYASSAGRLTSPATEAEAPASALTSAKRHGGEPPESTTSSASANGAGPSSPSTSTRAPATARSYVEHVRGAGRSAVYDLTVDGAHEFFANGVLVHNSLDAARYAIYSTEQLWRHHMRG